MTTHLTPQQLVDALEGQTTLCAGAVGHLAACERCQSEIAALAQTLGDVRTWSTPEPSPLFWDHFSRRVRAATIDEVPGGVAPWTGVWSRVWRPFAAVAMATGALTLILVFRSAHVSAPGTAPPAGPATVATEEAMPTPASLDVANDEALNVIAVLAQDLRTDELQQVARPSADATGAAIEDLTPAQRAELVKLIKSESGGAE